MTAAVEMFGHNLVGTYIQAAKNLPLIASEDEQNGTDGLPETCLVLKPSARPSHMSNLRQNHHESRL